MAEKIVKDSQGLAKDIVNDCISRKAAIDALDVLCQEHRYRIPGKVETYSQYNEAWQDALGRAEGVIGNLPSAQPEEDCDTCKHGYFGGACCNNCKVRFPSHYERRTR